MYDFEKTLLYLYPRAEYFKNMYVEMAEAKIAKSFACVDTEKLVWEVLERTYLARAFEEWRQVTEDVLKQFTKEELCLLEYKYFRRKKYLKGLYEGFEFSCSYSSFFRRIRVVTKKFAELLSDTCYTEKRFLTDFENCSIVMNAYKSVQNGKAEFFLRGKTCPFSFQVDDHSSPE